MKQIFSNQLLIPFDYDDKETKFNEELKKQQEKIHFLLKDETNKRHNQIENTQIQIIDISSNILNKRYYKDGVEIDTSFIYRIRKNENQWYLDKNGVICSKKEKKACLYNGDTKTFDSILPITIKGIDYYLCGVLKGTERHGGHQDDVKTTIADYARLIQLNKNKNISIFFLLDGSYINKDINKLDKSDRYFTTTSDNFCKDLENFITKKLYG